MYVLTSSSKNTSSLETKLVWLNKSVYCIDFLVTTATMETIDEIKKGPAHKSPYPKALRAQIVKIVQKEIAHEISLADHTGAIKCVGYDNICHDFHEGQVIMLRQFQRGISGILLANIKKTHVRLCPALTHQ